MKPSYSFVASPNFSRRSKPITAIVIHYTGSIGTESVLKLFQNEESRSSAHYLIARDGNIFQLVREENVAWHAGRSILDDEPNVNSFSIGIELVGTMDSGFTDRQLASLYELVSILVSNHKIRPERVVGHCHIAPGRKIDPDGVDNQFPWSKLRSVAQSAYNSQ